MKNIIIILVLIFTLNTSAQIDLQYNSSSVFYVSESCKSTKQLSHEVAINILLELSKVKDHQLTIDKFILTNEYDNTYTGNLDMHDDSMLVTFYVTVIYDGSSARWSIPPIHEWSLKPREATIAVKKREDEEYKKKLDALIDGVGKSKEHGTNIGSDDNQNGDKGQLDGNPYSPTYYGSSGSRNRGYGLNGRGKPTYKLFKPDCNEEGKIIVEIVVDRNGDVIEATPGVRGTTNGTACLRETAKKIALSYKWIADKNAPAKQIGFVSIGFSIGH